MTGVERRPIADAYWQAADPGVRMGANADTFLEFDARVSSFVLELPDLPDNSILFGHGFWFALFWWRLCGFRVEDSNSMRAFTDFRRELPMPNCAVYVLDAIAPGEWSMTANTRATRAVTAVAGVA
jgi:broad specificity phosphatase PhoE